MTAEIQDKPQTQTSEFNILVIDDEDSVCQTICNIVKKGGYKVLGVKSVSEALASLKKSPFHLVLTDLIMPDVNGWQHLKVLKKYFAHIPIVALAGYLSDQVRSSLQSENLAGYLTKPIDSQRLQAMLKAILFPNNLGRLADAVVLGTDNNALREIHRALNERGFYAHVFQNTNQAAMHLRRSVPDLLITELQLPNTNGFDFCQTLWSKPNTAQVPVIMLASSPSKNEVIKAIQMGIQGFIMKPFKASLLGDRALEILQRTTPISASG